MDKEIQELLEQIALEGFFVKSSKGNYLAVTKQGDKWIAQGKEVTRESDIEYLNKQYETHAADHPANPARHPQGGCKIPQGSRARAHGHPHASEAR